MRIRPIQQTDVPRATAIDVVARAGDFLPTLGRPFLSTLYSALLRSTDVWGFVYEEDDHLVGFAIGCSNIAHAMRQALLQAGLPLLFHGLGACTKRPTLIPAMLETLRYPRKLDVRGPELLVIAVAPRAQGRGIGTQLINALTGSFIQRGFDHYHLTVKATNEQANRFYRHRGFHDAGTLHMYGGLWNIYRFPLPPSAPSGTAPHPRSRPDTASATLAR